jgi:hypothetical protein
MRNFCTAQGVITSFANNRLDFRSDDRGLIVSSPGGHIISMQGRNKYRKPHFLSVMISVPDP